MNLVKLAAWQNEIGKVMQHGRTADKNGKVSNITVRLIDSYRSTSDSAHK